MTPYGTSDALIAVILKPMRIKRGDMYSSRKPVTYLSVITAGREPPLII